MKHLMRLDRILHGSDHCLKEDRWIWFFAWVEERPSGQPLHVAVVTSNGDLERLDLVEKHVRMFDLLKEEKDTTLGDLVGKEVFYTIKNSEFTRRV